MEGTINNQPPLIAIPKKVVFKDIDERFNYEVNVLIKTFSVKSKIIRFIKPKSSNFKVKYKLEDLKACGMNVFVNIRFEADELKDY